MVSVTIAGAFAAAVGTYWSLLVAAIIGGSGYALVNAGTNVAMAHAVPIRRRTLAMSVKTAGVPAMAAITAAVGPWAANRWSWQHVIWALVILTILAAVGAGLILGNDRNGEGGGDTGSLVPLPTGFIWFPVGAFLLIAGVPADVLLGGPVSRAVARCLTECRRWYFGGGLGGRSRGDDFQRITQ